MADQLRPAEMIISSPELKTIVEYMGESQKRRFHVNARDFFIIEENEELDGKLILDFIKKHESEQVPRLQELLDYLENNNHGILERADRDRNLSDVRASHPFAAYITGFTVGYIAGEGIRVSSEDVSNQEIINKFNFDDLNPELLMDCSTYGKAYELVPRSEGIDNVVRLDPKQTFIIYDDSIEMQPVAGVRYWKNRKGEYVVKVYTSTQIRQFAQGADGSLVEGSPESHYYLEVPIIEYRNNRVGQGDFEKVLDIIDLYDFAQSDMANYSVDLNNALLVILGDMKLDPNDAANMRDKNILILEPAIDEFGHYSNTDAKYIYKQYDVAGTEAYKKRVEKDIHKFTNTPDMNDENFAGTQSGESMKYKLFGMEQTRVIKQALFAKSARKRYGLLFRINRMEILNSPPSYMDDSLEFIFTPNTPKSFYEEVDAFIKLGGKLSQETILTLISLVKDPETEMKKIEKEETEAIKKAQEAFASGRQFSDQSLNPNNQDTEGE